MNNEPAFPSPPIPHATDDRFHQRDGIDLLSQVALACMAQLIAHKERLLSAKPEYAAADAEEAVAEAAFLQAEAFMAARERRLKSPQAQEEWR